MAKISITFSGVIHYTDATNEVESNDDITLATDKVGCDVFLAIDEPATKFLKYSMNIKDLSFQKKILSDSLSNPIDGKSKICS